MNIRYRYSPIFGLLLKHLLEFLGLQAFPSCQPFRGVPCHQACLQVQVDQVCLALQILLSLLWGQWHQVALSNPVVQQDPLCLACLDRPSLPEDHLHRDLQQGQ